jgi:hypothetical protein
MQPEDRQKIGLILILRALFWLEAARRTEVLHTPKWRSLYALLRLTPQKPILIMAVVSGLIFAGFVIFLLKKLNVSDFSGAPYKKFYRGARILPWNRKLWKKRSNRSRLQVSYAS